MSMLTELTEVGQAQQLRVIARVYKDVTGDDMPEAHEMDWHLLFTFLMDEDQLDLSCDRERV